MYLWKLEEYVWSKHGRMLEKFEMCNLKPDDIKFTLLLFYYYRCILTEKYHINFACCRKRCPLSNCSEENKRENEIGIPTSKRCFYVLEFLKRTNETQSKSPC